MNTQPLPVPTVERTVTLQPVAMVTPTAEGVYAPSRIEPLKVVSYKRFLTVYADRPHQIKVSFEPDGKSNWQWMTAYGFAFDCWYIIKEATNEAL